MIIGIKCKPFGSVSWELLNVFLYVDIGFRLKNLTLYVILVDLVDEIVSTSPGSGPLRLSHPDHP